MMPDGADILLETIVWVVIVVLATIYWLFLGIIHPVFLLLSWLRTKMIDVPTNRRRRHRPQINGLMSGAPPRLPALPVASSVPKLDRPLQLGPSGDVMSRNTPSQLERPVRGNPASRDTCVKFRRPGRANRQRQVNRGDPVQFAAQAAASETGANCESTAGALRSSPDNLDMTRNEEKMTHETINGLLDIGESALAIGDLETAGAQVRQAVRAVNKYKDAFLSGLDKSLDEQQLADWFGRCSFILNKIGAHLNSAKCFYTATVFDNNWDTRIHHMVAAQLWGRLVMNAPLDELKESCQSICKFLGELDRVAKLAEQRKRWELCVVMDGDINKVYGLLRDRGLGPSDINKIPGRREGIMRTTRCCLELKDYGQVKLLCKIILQDFCEYDNAEAFLMWSQALHLTKEHKLALDKCNQGISCAKNDEQRERLEKLKEEIQNATLESVTENEVDEDWLEGTCASPRTMSMTRERSSTPECKSKKRRHKRPKARMQRTPSMPDLTSSLQNTASAPTATRTAAVKTLYSRQNPNNSNPTRDYSPVLNGARPKETKSRFSRRRYRSVCSTVSDMSVQSYQCSLSDSDDSSVGTDSTTASNESMVNDFPEDEVEIDEDDASFYEQSCRFHQQRDVSERTDTIATDEALLLRGITLNDSFVQGFEDRHPDIINRDMFYEDRLSELELKEKLLQNPKKYIRCVIHMEGAHEATCTPIESTLDCSVIEISGRSKVGQVFNEDEVVVELLHSGTENEKRYGKVLGVLDRQRHKGVKHPVFMCTIDDIESHLVRPMCKTLPKIHILNREIAQKYNYKMRKFKVEIYEYDEKAQILSNPRIIDVNTAGEKTFVFMVAYIGWSPRHVYPIGAVIKLLPLGNTIPRGIMILNRQHEVPSLYQSKTVDYVESITRRCTDEPDEVALKGRLDLTELNTFTIDPPNSRDLDDALSIELRDDHYCVGVHISDVTFYVRKGDPLDEEAMTRSTTYYPGIRKPRCMLPEPLSGNLCSLISNKNRLTLSVFFLLDKEGRPLQIEGNNYKIKESFIKSKRQLSYGEVQTILNDDKPTEEPTHKDIKRLFKLATQIRKRRLGNSMFAMSIDWEENMEDESMLETFEAHYLVEEFMVMANKKIAEVLVRKYPTSVPIRVQPPPSKEGLDSFSKKNGSFTNILVRMQDKKIAGTEKGVEVILSNETLNGASIPVMKEVWEAMKKSPAVACRLLRQDDLFPLQHVVYQQWLAIQERAAYRSSGSVGGAEGGTHFSLGYYPYTHFTSPIRRYNDVVVHRLLKALLHGMNSPYSKKEIDNICVHMNSAFRRSKEYQKGCRTLQQAIDFSNKQPMVNCFVDDITDRGIGLCSPLFRYVRKGNREMSFNLLDMGFKPEVFEDQTTKWDCVKATWRKRIYDHNGTPPPYLPDQEDIPIGKLNSKKNTVSVPIQDWARFLKAGLDGRFGDVQSQINQISKNLVCNKGEGLDDISTECSDAALLQPSTMFFMTYSRGQAVTLQMSASTEKGMISAKPMLYKMTNNAIFCLLHNHKPVLHLYEYVTRSTLDKYQSAKQYLERWVPLILMEAATGILKNEESCVINNVPIKFSNERKGRFALSLDYCETRNIEISGTQSDDEDDCDVDSGSESSYDWLCIKAPVPISDCVTDKMHSQYLKDHYWVGHADIKRVVKKRNYQHESGGKLTVSFELHQKTASVPYQIKNGKPETKYSVEILKKSEVDRRTESIIKTLPSKGSSLAVQIALNKTIPDLEQKRKLAVNKLPVRDLFYDVDPEEVKRKPLPRNNPKQQEAVDKALTSSFSLIQGPPGTGKTHTGIKLIYLFDKINQEMIKSGKQRKQVLFCGPSNKSVDLVADWLLHRIGSYRPNFVRVYGRSIEAMEFPIPGRTFLSKRSTHNLMVDPRLKEVALHHIIREKGKKHAEEINAYDRKFKKEKYAPMPDDVKKYVHIILEASIEEIRKFDVILCTTAVGTNPKVLKATSVYQVIVDEAGMCPEPQCLVPIIATEAKQVVLIGDHKQLSPIIMCREAGELGLQKSLFERYALCSNSKNVQFTMLEIQYRMHQQICYFPSKHFYENKLQTPSFGPWMHDPLPIWPSDQYGAHPHVLVHIEGEEKVLTVSTEDGNEQSKSNAKEVEYVVELYRKLITQMTPSDTVYILSQYNAQCSEIKRRLREEGLSDRDVSTVVSSQGGEWSYVIFSTVRSLPEYKIEKNPTLGWCKHNLGFITDQNQVNVALTRAKKGHIIVGNRNLLACDYTWKKLVAHYESNGCILTPETFPPQARTLTRQEIMNRAYDSTYRRYGETIFERGQATSWEGEIDEPEYQQQGQRRRRPPPRFSKS